MPRILIEPNAHHLENLGDAAMLQTGYSRLRAHFPQSTISVITERPDLLETLCPGARAVNAGGRAGWFHEPALGAGLRMLSSRLGDAAVSAERRLRRRSPSSVRALVRTRYIIGAEDWSPVRDFLDAVRSADMFVVSGAGALTDPFGPLALTVLDLIAWMRRRGSLVAMMGQGFGPLTDECLERRASEVVPRLDLLTLREGISGPELLRRVGAPAEWCVTGDDTVELVYKRRRRELGGALGVSVRSARYSGVGGERLNALVPALRRASASLDAPVMSVPISRYRKERDAAVIDRVTDGLRRADGHLSEPRQPGDAIARIARCRAVVAGSYHAAVFALSQGIPVVALSASPYYRAKFLGLAEQFGGLLPIIDLDDGMSDLVPAIGWAWHGAERLRPQLLRHAEDQVQRGRAAYARLAELAGARSR
jgi:colanic acid/amylovoran biosynthesis protein